MISLRCTMNITKRLMWREVIKITIGVDIDETIAEMLSKILPLYNAKYSDTLEESHIHNYNLSPFINPMCNNIFEEFLDDKLIMSMDVMEGAVEVLSTIAKHHDVYFVTAGHPYTIRARDDWLERKFPFYRSSNLIVCREKQLLNLNVMIDDYENNLIGGMYAKILMTRNWNKQFAAEAFGIKRIFGWREVPAIIEKLERKRI
jgi:5'-nucleotidase